MTNITYSSTLFCLNIEQLMDASANDVEVRDCASCRLGPQSYLPMGISGPMQKIVLVQMIAPSIPPAIEEEGLL